MTSQTALKQRADYTYQYNRHIGRHGWLRLTPAYSVKLVEEILQKKDSELSVLDPFSGTATTPLCAGYHNHRAVGYELNPFLAWFGNVKTRHYSSHDMQSLEIIIHRIASDIRNNTNIAPCTPPPIHNISRWWDAHELEFLCTLKSVIDHTIQEESPESDILLVIFCRLIIKLSNAAFNHQSMSFKDNVENQALPLFEYTPDFTEIFLHESQQVLESAKDNPKGKVTIIQGDSRVLEKLQNETFDLLITSPPYPNRMSYIRELRPYMYWLKYLSSGREAGELDWKAIGGTWGIATSRLTDWERDPRGFYPPYFEKLLTDIAHGDNKNGQVLSNYVAKYFEDMWQHLSHVYRIMQHDGEVHYIIGNSIFYGTLVPVEVLYKDMLEECGFHNVTITTIRKRNSKKSLYEFDVSAKK
jgi:hypothetical protein